MIKRKGIILAGGAGTRLYPATLALSKQLLPVYDKPMIYYPLTTLMLAGINEILIISTATDIGRFESLLGNGKQWGISLQYAVQAKPEGIAQAIIIAEEFIDDGLACLILGDNIFHGDGLIKLLTQAAKRQHGATIFAYHIQNPQRYGVVEINDKQQAISIEEKPQSPKSNYVVTGIYFYDQQAVAMAKSLSPSARGELEISDLNRLYLQQQQLNVEIMGRGYAWLDAGTHESLLEASQFIAMLEKRQGLKVACPEEIAFRQKWISREQLTELAEALQFNNYGAYLQRILQESRSQ